MTKTRVRVLQVCNTDFYLGKFLAPLVRALDREGFAVECLTEGTGGAQALIQEGFKVHQLAFPAQASPLAFISAINEMTRILKQGQFHIVNGHNRNSSIISRVASALAGVPINLYTAHGFYFQDSQSQVARRATILLERLLAGLTTYTLSQSDEDTRLVTSKGWVRADRIRTIGNGVDTERFVPSASPRERSGRFTLCAMGRLVAGKGFEDILRAMSLSRHRDQLELLLIGGSIVQDIVPATTRFHDLARQLGLSGQVQVTGMVDNVEDYLLKADAFIHPSYAEGMPRSLLEAMSSGLPCIATSIRGAREIIQPGVNGLRYPPRDVSALAAHIDDLVADDSTRKKLGENARLTVLGGFQQPDYVQRQVDAMKELAMAKGLMSS